jgi:tRNA A-37 threonylcarbamoyl transferase component Bud32
MPLHLAEVSDALQGRYAIERELGRGGMATVYLAEDIKLHRHVALKVLRPELEASLGNERFLREIQIAARLSHPHILALHDSGESGGHVYYAMPYVEGESLRQRLEREGQLPIGEVIAIVRAVASALTYAHHHGVVHRDIKPENILLAKDPEGGGAHPLVADFGIARALDAAGGERLTETGLALGTPAYMSPEQSAADRRLDGRADIYALGCVAYEMLAGSPPFTGPTAQAILARHAVDPVPPLHTVRATVPPAVEAAIERALAKVPADRFSTADDFARALTAEHVPVPLRRRLASPQVRVAMIMTAAAAAVGLGATLLGRSPPSVVPSAATMAILPFFAGGADTALIRLGRDLAVTLSASLDGIGGIETADRLTVANATADRGSHSPAQGAALARRLGSSSFLRGTLVRAGDNVRLDLGLYTVDGLAPLAEGITVTAHRDSVGMLTDSASWALLRQVWQRGDPPSPSLEAVTTRSLPALRAFLEGERELGANEWGKAALAFRSAIAADSGFGLAYFRYALTQWWSQQPLEPDLLAALRTYSQVLAEREQLLVDAFLTSERTPRLRIEGYGDVTRRFPNYWPAWFLYADALYHNGPIVGYDWSEGLNAFRRVIALNPKLVPAWEHVFDLTVGKDRTGAAQAFDTLTQLGWLAAQPPGGRLLSRLLAATASEEGMWSAATGSLADSMAKFVCCGTRVAKPPLADYLALELEPLFLLQAGFPAAQLELNRRALNTGKVANRIATVLQAGNAWAWAARGQWDSALATMSGVASTAAQAPGVPALAFQNYGLAVLGALLGATPPSLADQRRPGVVSHLGRLTDEKSRQFSRANLAWLDGTLGFARRDRRAIRAARGELAKSGWYQVNLVDRSLAAMDQGLIGDREEAGRKLEELEQHCIDHEDCNSFIPHIAVQRFVAAQWLQEAGHLEHAARLLRWQEAAWGGWDVIFRDALGGPSYLVRARIEEARADSALARGHYQQFLRRYDQPMPSQAHLVTEAKAALARLGGDR